jgi:ribosomal protein L34E
MKPRENGLTRQAMAEAYIQKARKLEGGVAVQLLTFADTLKKCLGSRRPCGINPCPWCLAKRIAWNIENVLTHLKGDADDEFRSVVLRVPRPVPARDLLHALNALRVAVGKVTRGKKVWAKHVGPWAGRLRGRPRAHPAETSARFRLSARFIVAGGGGLDREDLEARWRDLLLDAGLGSSNHGPAISIVDAGSLKAAVSRLCGTARKTLGSIATMVPAEVPAYLATLERVHRPILGRGTVQP